MTAIPFVGKCFPTAKEFLDYLDDIKFGAWRPRYVTMHHTGGPSLKTWRTYAHGTRKVPITDAQWMKNLASYYGNEMKWSSGPHFFFTPDNFCVLSLPDRRGVHAKSFNADSWGVECVGEFDSEAFTSELANRYAEGFACLYLALGLSPGPYEYRKRGLHFHRDDPLTNKTCPGKKVNRDSMINLIGIHIAAMSEGSSVDDNAVPVTTPKKKIGTVVGVKANDTLSIRDEASGKSPKVGELKPGAKVEITGEAKNGNTLWYQIKGGDYVSGRYIKLD